MTRGTGRTPPARGILALEALNVFMADMQAGVVIDATSHKRLYVIVPGICTVLASAIILLSQQFWLVAASQIATAVAGAAIAPAVAGITLGMVRQSGFNRQNGRNQDGIFGTRLGPHRNGRRW